MMSHHTSSCHMSLLSADILAASGEYWSALWLPYCKMQFKCIICKMHYRKMQRIVATIVIKCRQRESDFFMRHDIVNGGLTICIYNLHDGINAPGYFSHPVMEKINNFLQYVYMFFRSLNICAYCKTFFFTNFWIHAGTDLLHFICTINVYINNQTFIWTINVFIFNCYVLNLKKYRPVIKKICKRNCTSSLPEKPCH